MVMNSIILNDHSGIITDPVILRHIRETLKLRINDTIKCTILNVGLFTAQVVELSENACKLNLQSSIQSRTPWFDLVVGVSRPQTTKKILEHATTFGAGKIHFFKASLSEKSYLDAKIFENNSFLEHTTAGLSQSALYFQLPEIKVDKYNPASQYLDDSNKFILDLKADKSFLDQDIDFSMPITLAVGPERGFVPEDISRFHAAGFKSVKISSSILRVEHAIYSAISQLELIRKKY
jgi:16S rRNA (uracil1498-N3)-methyltransferase